MRTPSQHALEAAFPGKGRILKALLTDAATVKQHPAALALVRQCLHTPTMYHMRLAAINAELEGHGIEYQHAGKGPRSPAFSFINMGEMYAATIVRYASGRYAVTDIGTIVERGNYE
jgi:hypothetical protein